MDLQAKVAMRAIAGSFSTGRFDRDSVTGFVLAQIKGGAKGIGEFALRVALEEGLDKEECINESFEMVTETVEIAMEVLATMKHEQKQDRLFARVLDAEATRETPHP